MGAVLLLVDGHVSVETLEMLAAQRDAAAKGDVIGAAVILLHPGGHYTIDVAGMVREDPTWVRGILAKLDDELAHLPPSP